MPTPEGIPEIKVVLNSPTGHQAHRSRMVTAIQWKTFLTALGAVLAMAVAVVPTLYGVTWWITAAAIGVVGIAAIVKSGDAVLVTDVFKPLRFDQQRRVAMLIRMAVGSYICWSIVYVARPSWSLYLLAVLPLLGLAIYGLARYEEYHIGHAKAVKRIDSPLDESFEDRERAKSGRRILDAAGHPRVRIIGHSTIQGEQPWESGNQFTVQVPPTGMGK